MIWGSPIFGNTHIKINGGTSSDLCRLVYYVSPVAWPVAVTSWKWIPSIVHVHKAATKALGGNQGESSRNRCGMCFFSRWWFQICFTFTPKRKEDSHFDEHIFQKNLRNRRYYISWHQVSRSVSKSSGRIGSKRKNDTYIVYMYTVYMWDA